ncbi:hypothetical protein E2C01_083229 [Portunus trituberculatus]|uniref:Uncharacterized protein n=1 Tax=Portunus trituberculatus TaxID=210409 RepID=A0A5B7J5W4_PORTR|nr:hypothetical protein [Portunus trituberculatus]
MAERDLHCVMIGLERGLTSPGSHVVRHAPTKFEFKSPSVHSVICGHKPPKVNFTKLRFTKYGVLLYNGT